MALIECPACGGDGKVLCRFCGGNSCSSCEEGANPCPLCGGECQVDEPLICPTVDCSMVHGNTDTMVFNALVTHRVGVRESRCLTCARIDSVDRRWAKQAKKCKCGAYVLWRMESGRRIPLDNEGRAHACDPAHLKGAK